MAATTAPNRQKLSFQTLDDITRFVEPLPALGAGSSGNWTAAQNIEHVALFIDTSIDGFTFAVPAPIRFAARMLRGRFLKKGFKPGIKPPAKAAVHFAPRPDITMEEAVDHLIRSIERAKANKMTAVSPLFGAMDHEQWTQMHCRHAELHFSFIQPEQA
tara:strand:+ start:256 stop:732 length:477 start_codon:yes stop_codon:yes gene_type:complete